MSSIGFLGIPLSRRDTGFDFAQARYLFPFLAFYAAFVALAALRRRAPLRAGPWALPRDARHGVTVCWPSSW